MNFSSNTHTYTVPESNIPLARGLLHRKCACGQSKPAGGTCESCKKKQLNLQRQSTNQSKISEVPSIVHDVLGSLGQPLDTATRTFMEPRFGHDFSGVKIHTDAKASESARAVNALAYTVGNHIVFRTGRYNSQSNAGRKLLAHELTHTVQQNDSHLSRKTLSIGKEDSLLEKNADANAERVMSTSPRAISIINTLPHIQRTCGPRAIGSVSGCTGLGGQDITDVGTNSNDIYNFEKDCDDFRPGDAARLSSLASTLSVGDTVDIHGFASEEGDPAFNDNLSCARAHAAANILSGLVPLTLFKHGAILGPREDRRAVVIVVNTPAPVPTPAPGCITPTNPDLSGSAFNPTTAGQTSIALSHPIDALTARSLADDSFTASRRSGLAGPHLGPQDAFRHCFWSCRMTQELGSGRAEQFGTGHENSGPSSISFDNQMDLHDNATGRSIGIPGANCETECTSAVTSGQLRTVRGPHTRPVSPVSTTCIGASDQPWP